MKQINWKGKEKNFPTIVVKRDLSFKLRLNAVKFLIDVS